MTSCKTQPGRVTSVSHLPFPFGVGTKDRARRENEVLPEHKRPSSSTTRDSVSSSSSPLLQDSVLLLSMKSELMNESRFVCRVNSSATSVVVKLQIPVSPSS